MLLKEMDDSYKITYSFSFSDGSSKEFEVNLDRATLSLLNKSRSAAPAWAQLGFHQCPMCSLDASRHMYCPIALNLASIISEFQASFSHESVNLKVSTEERDYVKQGTVQEGLSALFGIIMVTSGCPVMERLKPMVRFHLPFATILESIYRSASSYLLAQHFLDKSGAEADFKLNNLGTIFAQINELNTAFAQRVSEAATRDAAANALVNLDCFAQMAFDAESVLDEIRPYFSAYFSK